MITVYLRNENNPLSFNTKRRKGKKRKAKGRKGKDKTLLHDKPPSVILSLISLLFTFSSFLFPPLPLLPVNFCFEAKHLIF